MVIARPKGEEDAGYRAVARPLFDKLDAVAGKVEVELSRPPTFARLKALLTDAKRAGRPYHILHFDGHGTFGVGAGGGADPLRFRGPEQGYLLFEGASDDERLVSAAAFGEAIDEAGVPLVVFNACRSGQLGSEVGPEATVATRLMQSGTAAVVAMSYSVYVRAAAEFMAAFYEALFQGEPVTRAVARGRRRLRDRPLRPSPKGDLPLKDWCVPVHYGRREVVFPGLRREETGTRKGLSLDHTLDRVAEQDRADAETQARDPLAPAGGRFFGRDREFYRLERAIAADPKTGHVARPVMLIQGQGGAGKTELAKAYARWLVQTGWAEGALLHSFEPGVATFGLDGLTSAVGLALFGTDFALKTKDPVDRAAVVLDVLKNHRIILVLDNFESARSMPTGATPPLDDAEAERLRAFLAAASAGVRSLILITSRSDERWLAEESDASKVNLERLALGGLLREEVSEYADHLLADKPRARERRAEEKAFGELLEWLECHPLSLRLILPRLEDASVADLIVGLTGQQPLPTGRGDEGLPERHRTLDACVAYSLEQLPAEDRQRLFALSLFEGCAVAAVLANLAQVEEPTTRFRGVSRGDWGAVLDRVTSLGLLTSLGAGVYRLHPALPRYLRGAWREQAGAVFEAEWDAAEQAFIAVSAGFGGWLLQQIQGGEAATAMSLIDLQRRSLGRALGEALRRRKFAEAQAIMEPLEGYSDARGLVAEANGWVARARDATEDDDGHAPDFDTPAGALWLFAVGAEANRAINAGHLDEAERAHRKIAQVLEASKSANARRHLATAYHQLGNVAYARGALDDAEAWYKKSLAIKEALGDRAGMAMSYHQLGMVAQQRGALDDAEALYKKSLAIKEALGDRPGMATSYHQLGNVAYARGALEDAEAWYKKALAIAEALDNRPYVAAITHQLGMVVQARGALDDAEAWYKKSLAIKEALGDRPLMATSYHQLGMVAQARGALDDAEAWYKKSLAIKEALGNRPSLALTYAQLGVLEQERGNREVALEWAVRCVSLFGDFPNPQTGSGPWDLVQLTAALGMDALEDSWRRLTGKALPADVRAYVEAAMREGSAN
jgi:tetratricopeptide (TPR) repeat protein